MPKKSITVLGIHDGHDAGAVLIRDGGVLAALQEERPRNIKHYSGIPEYAIREVLRIAKVHPSEVEVIAVAGLVRMHAPLKERPLHEKLSPYVACHTFAKSYVKVFHRFREMKHLRKVFRELDIENKEVVYVDTPEDAVRNAVELIHDENLELGTKTRSLAERFTWEKNADKSQR